MIKKEQQSSQLQVQYDTQIQLLDSNNTYTKKQGRTSLMTDHTNNAAKAGIIVSIQSMQTF